MWLCLSMSQGPDDYSGRINYIVKRFILTKLYEEILGNFGNSNETILEDSVPLHSSFLKIMTYFQADVVLVVVCKDRQAVRGLRCDCN